MNKDDKIKEIMEEAIRDVNKKVKEIIEEAKKEIEDDVNVYADNGLEIFKFIATNDVNTILGLNKIVKEEKCSYEEAVIKYAKRNMKNMKNDEKVKEIMKEIRKELYGQTDEVIKVFEKQSENRILEINRIKEKEGCNYNKAFVKFIEMNEDSNNEEDNNEDGNE